MFHREERNDKQWQQGTDQYPEVFREELDTMKGEKTHIQGTEGAILRHFKPKLLAYTLVREIERQQIVGTAVPVTHLE